VSGGKHNDLEPATAAKHHHQAATKTTHASNHRQAANAILDTIEKLHKKLRDDYTVRWELDRYLLVLHTCINEDGAVISDIPPEWMVLELSDTFHYHNLPDIAHVIRSTFMGVCCAPWLQKLFNMFMCGKRYRRLINTSHTTCQLTAAIINTLHGLLLGLYPFNERRMGIRKRAWLAGAMRDVLTDAQHTTFINEHPFLICLGLAEYIVNVIDDFCPVEWILLGVTTSAKSQCLAAFESFRENCISEAVNTPTFWSHLEAEAQPVVNSLVKFFREATFYQHKQRTILHPSTIQYLPLAMSSRTVQNSSSIFGQLKAAIPSIGFAESEALEEIWTSVYIRSLPSHTTLKQMETLSVAGQMCCLVEEEMHHFPLCVACTLTKRADVLRGMFRFDAVDERLVCNECAHHAHVVNINMLGRVLYVRDKAIVLCEKCLRPKYWDSICVCITDDATPQRTCCACQNTNIVSSKEVVDVDAMEMKSMHFCYKHSLSCVLNQKTIYDLKSIEAELCARHQSQALQHNSLSTSR
jgi:uncharacterized FlaG/YvyC family protein